MKYYENETIETKILIYPKSKEDCVKINELFEILKEYEEESLFTIITNLLEAEDIDRNININSCLGTVQTIEIMEELYPKYKDVDYIYIYQLDYDEPHLKVWKYILDKLYPELDMVFMFKDTELDYLGTNDKNWFFKHYMCHVKLLHFPNANPLCEKIGEEEIKKLSEEYESESLILIKDGFSDPDNCLEYEAYFDTFEEMQQHLKNIHGYVIETEETFKDIPAGDFILTTKAFQYYTLNSLG